MRLESIRTVLRAALLTAFTAFPAAAQDLGAIEGLFEEVSAVTVFLQTGGVTGSDQIQGDHLYGAGTEVILDLKAGDAWDLELGLGASFLRGYQEKQSELDLRTSLRAFPTLTLYATPLELGDLASIYTGVSFGLVEMWNAQAYDSTGTPWDVEGRTFEFGASAGLYIAPRNGVGVFAEGGYRQREFGSLKWTIPETDSLPESWRSLNFSGYYLQAGVQLRLEEDEDRNDDITPPAPAGVWTLVRMDGSDLPGTLETAAGSSTQVLHAVLRLRPDSTLAEADSGAWTLELNLRHQRPGGTAPRLEHTTVEGTYTVREQQATRKHVLTLVPANTDGGPRLAERLAGRLHLNWNGHVLVFAPGNAP